MERYLSKLETHKARHVQLIEDGAQWIWKQLPVMLRHLGGKQKAANANGRPFSCQKLFTPAGG